MKRIAVEEHFTTKGYMDYLYSRKEIPRIEIVEDEKNGRLLTDWIMPELGMTYPETSNIGERSDLNNVRQRLSDMDEAGIDMQVLSLRNPGVEEFDSSDAITWAKKVNDELAQFVNKYPERFAGYAKIAWREPAAAIEELERSVKELRLKGVKIDSHIRGEYLDDKKYWPIFEKVEELGVPVHIHPRGPSSDMLKPYLAYPSLPFAMWGFAADVGLHAMRLICSGLFDEFPRLKIILGHMGEGLSFWLWRMDKHMPSSTVNLRKRPSEYVKDNFFMATSGNFSQPALMCTYLALGADNILFAVDYPPESNKEAVQFMEAAPICASDKEKICHLNAEKLLGL